MIGRLVALAALAGASAGATVPPARAADDAPAFGAGADQLARLQSEIAQLSVERDRFRAQAQTIVGRLDALAADARLADAKLESLVLRRRAGESALDAMKEREVQAARRLEADRVRFRTTLRLVWEVGPSGPLKPVLSASDTARFAAGLRTGHELLRRQAAEVAAVRSATATLSEVRRGREAQERELAALTTQRQAVRSELAQAIADRRALLAELETKAETREAAISEMARASDELGRLIADQGDAGPVPLDVTRFKGLLPMPAEAPVTRVFGDRRDARLGTRLPHNGWDIAAPFGAPVRSIFDGKVVFADWFRGYGLMTIVDHGHGVHSVYAHLSALLAPTGSVVAKGESLGRVGDTGSLEGPLLYLEVRRNGKAENPADWINIQGL